MKLTNHAGIRNCIEAFTLKRVLSKAIEALDQAGAWPNHQDGIMIRIVKPGDQIGAGGGSSSMRSESATEDFPAAGVVKRESGTPMAISVRSNLFADGLGQQLAKGGASKKQVATFMLAHEIFHLTEPDRQEAAGVPNAHRRSSLAGAAMGDMPSEWKAALKAIFAQFQSDEVSPDYVVKAGHIANEAAADLTGLHWLNQVEAKGFDEFKDALIKARRMAEISGKGYAIADALETVLASGLPSPGETAKACWQLAIDQLAMESDLDEACRNELNALPSLLSARQINSAFNRDQLSP